MKLASDIVGFFVMIEEEPKHLVFCDAGCLTWIMEFVVATKKLIISNETGCLEKIFKASLSDIV